MALVRVYCGVATAEMAPWLTVAVVDDAGRLLDMRHISDDPAGYAYLVALLAERSAGLASVAVDRHEHLVAQLLAAANRPLAITDEMTLSDVAERFSDDTSYDEVQAPPSQRRAIGLARALQAGALYATAQSPSWDLDELKPVLAAHGAITAGRQAAAVALREVLRELFPAALRAYLDPAEHIPLRILETFPEPSLLTSSPSTRTRETTLVADLSASGVTDATTAVNAITALRVAVEETRGWNANRLLAPAVAETVRQAVAAVRACDAAAAALVASLVERLAAMTNGGPATRPPLVHPAAAPVSPAVPRRAPGPAAEVPASRLAPRASAASAAAAGVAAAGLNIPAPRPEPGFPPPGSRANWPTHAGDDDYAVAHPNGGSTYNSDYGTYGSDQPTAAGTSWATPPPYDDVATTAFESSYGGAASSYGASSAYGTASGPPANGSSYGSPSPSYGSPSSSYASAYESPSYESPSYDAPSYESPSYESPSYESSSYELPSHERPAYESSYDSPSYESSYGSSSFSSDPLNAPLEPPAPTPHLRLVENPPSFADPTPPPLRVIDGGRQSDSRAVDDDLLIFSEASSKWFMQVPQSDVNTEPPNWGSLAADDGWRAAERLIEPTVGAQTTAGLPRRVPQANLVPGSAQADRQLRIVRDAQSIAAHTEGYFRGWRRGQEVGGFAVGQRDRAAWEFNREQRAREGARLS